MTGRSVRPATPGAAAQSEPLFSINAVNLPEHADNPVHTDAGAIEAGFAGAIVAGTTVYAYLVRGAVGLYGSDWASQGGGILTLRAPVLADALVEVRQAADGRLAACMGDVECARLVPRTVAETVEALADRDLAPSGRAFGPMTLELSEIITGYGLRCGDDDPRYGELGVVHPVVWPVLANAVFARYLVRGPWVHTRSDIFHIRPVAPGATVTIEATEIDRFAKPSGERAVLAMRFTVDDELVAFVEHEAII